jgi:hypothetical protein
MQTLSDKSSFLERNLQFSVLQLASWPSLPDLLLETAPHVTRICALLARKPSVGMLIPVMLDMPPHMTYSLLDTLYAKGHICSVGGVIASEQVAQLKAEPVPGPELPAATASFLGKVWHRLMDRK